MVVKTIRAGEVAEVIPPSHLQRHPSCSIDTMNGFKVIDADGDLVLTNRLQAGTPVYMNCISETPKVQQFCRLLVLQSALKFLPSINDARQQQTRVCGFGFLFGWLSTALANDLLATTRTRRLMSR